VSLQITCFWLRGELIMSLGPLRSSLENPLRTPPVIPAPWHRYTLLFTQAFTSPCVLVPGCHSVDSKLRWTLHTIEIRRSGTSKKESSRPRPPRVAHPMPSPSRNVLGARTIEKHVLSRSIGHRIPAHGRIVEQPSAQRPSHKYLLSRILKAAPTQSVAQRTSATDDLQL